MNKDQLYKIYTDGLKDFLPALSLPQIVDWLVEYQVAIKVSKPRRTKLGDYRPPQGAYNFHRISVNGDLNPYSFLTVLVHEIAHLTTYQLFGRKVKPHGPEWIHQYQYLMDFFMRKNIFPPKLEATLEKSLVKPPASCSDVSLMRALKEYDQIPKGSVFVENLAENDIFSTSNGRVFQKGKKLRKRYRCIEIATKKIYLFNPIAEVFLVTNK